MIIQNILRCILPEITQSYGSINYHHLTQITDVIDYAMQQYPRVLALRVDLHFPYQDGDMPSYEYRADSAVISRFIDALKAKIAAEALCKKRMGKAVHPCQLLHIWVRECCTSHHEHYHLLLLFNRDRYFRLGNFDNKDDDTLLNKIRASWASALALQPGDAVGLVHIPANAEYYLERQRAPAQLEAQIRELLFRVGYLAKLNSKINRTGYRSFGCSRVKKTD